MEEGREGFGTAVAHGAAWESVAYSVQADNILS